MDEKMRLHNLPRLLDGFADLVEADVLNGAGRREAAKAMREAAAALRQAQSTDVGGEKQ